MLNFLHQRIIYFSIKIISFWLDNPWVNILNVRRWLCHWPDLFESLPPVHRNCLIVRFWNQIFNPRIFSDKTEKKGGGEENIYVYIYPLQLKDNGSSWASFPSAPVCWYKDKHKRALVTFLPPRCCRDDAGMARALTDISCRGTTRRMHRTSYFSPRADNIEAVYIYSREKNLISSCEECNALSILLFARGVYY